LSYCLMTHVFESSYVWMRIDRALGIHFNEGTSLETSE
jgi:hypothetical protein